MIAAHVFTCAGGSGKAWIKACTEARLRHQLAHDLRRTAARNMSRAGVPERVIMDLCGWKTRSVLDGYRITNEAGLAESLAKLASYEQEAPAAVHGRVVRFRTGTVRAQDTPA